jgi:hypothetical protein
MLVTGDDSLECFECGKPIDAWHAVADFDDYRGCRNFHRSCARRVGHEAADLYALAADGTRWVPLEHSVKGHLYADVERAGRD